MDASPDVSKELETEPALRAATAEFEREPSRRSIPAGVKPPRRARRHLAAALMIAAAGGLAAAGAQWLQYSLSHETTDDAYVAGNAHPVSSRVTGTVLEVLVDDNQRVNSGGLLVKLDPRDYEAELATAQAELAQAKALARKAALDRQRSEMLRNGKVIAPQDYDKAKADDEISSGLVQATQSKVALAELQLSYTQITAPATGRIGHKSVETGQRVEPGQPLMAIVEENVWIVANFKETQLAKLHEQQPVEIVIDTLKGRKFTGHIESFSPASGAEFALLPPDNATGNFTKIVQRVPVKIVFDPASIRGCENKIVPGLSAVVSVITR